MTGEDRPSQFLPAKGLNAGFSADDMVISMYEEPLTTDQAVLQ